MQPGGQGLPGEDGRGPSGQDKEHRLKGVLRVVDVVQNALAHRQHQRAVALDERGESGLVAFCDESSQQGGVGGLLRCRLRRQPAEVMSQGVRGPRS